jgi:hypothetical protein
MALFQYILFMGHLIYSATNLRNQYGSNRKKNGQKVHGGLTLCNKILWRKRNEVSKARGIFMGTENYNMAIPAVWYCEYKRLNHLN